MLLWTIHYDEETAKSEVQTRQILYHDDYLHDDKIIAYFNMIYIDQFVYFVTMSGAHDRLNIRSMSVYSGVLNGTYFSLGRDITGDLLHNVHCFNANIDGNGVLPRLGCLLHSSDFIWDVEVALPGFGQTIIREKFLFAENVVSSKQLKMRYSADYVAVLFSDKTQKVYVYKRQKSSSKEIGLLHGLISPDVGHAVRDI